MHDHTEWRPIPEFPGYVISREGKVKSLARTVPTKNGSVRRYPEKILSERYDPRQKQFCYVKLYKDGKSYQRGVKRMVEAVWYE